MTNFIDCSELFTFIYRKFLNLISVNSFTQYCCFCFIAINMTKISPLDDCMYRKKSKHLTLSVQSLKYFGQSISIRRGTNSLKSYDMKSIYTTKRYNKSFITDKQRHV